MPHYTTFSRTTTSGIRPLAAKRSLVLVVAASLTCLGGVILLVHHSGNTVRIREYRPSEEWEQASVLAPEEMEKDGSATLLMGRSPAKVVDTVAPGDLAPVHGIEVAGGGNHHDNSGHKAVGGIDVQLETFARPSGDRILVVAVVDIGEGLRIVHESLGEGDIIGMPSAVEIAARGVEWSAAMWPEPSFRPWQPLAELGQNPLIPHHAGTIVIRGCGVKQDIQSKGSAVKVVLKAVILSEDGFVTPLVLESTAEDAGADNLFRATFPCD